jgi:hypothetical protein
MGSRKRKIIRWTQSELKQLKAWAKSKPVKAIAKALKRSEAAIRYKAWEKNISFAGRKRRA